MADFSGNRADRTCVLRLLIYRKETGGCTERKNSGGYI